jgi:hypothetical protein
MREQKKSAPNLGYMSRLQMAPKSGPAGVPVHLFMISVL